MSEPADLGANLKNCPSLINYAPSSNTYSPAQRCVQTTEDRSEPTLKWHCEAETGISVKYMKMSVGGHTQPRAAMKTQPRAATVPISKQLKALSAFHIPYFAKVPVWFIRYVGVCRGFCRYRNGSSFNIELKKKKKVLSKGPLLTPSGETAVRKQSEEFSIGRFSLYALCGWLPTRHSITLNECDSFIFIHVKGGPLAFPEPPKLK